VCVRVRSRGMCGWAYKPQNQRLCAWVVLCVAVFVVVFVVVSVSLCLCLCSCLRCVCFVCVSVWAACTYGSTCTVTRLFEAPIIATTSKSSIKSTAWNIPFTGSPKMCVCCVVRWVCCTRCLRACAVLCCVMRVCVSVRVCGCGCGVCVGGCVCVCVCECV